MENVLRVSHWILKPSALNYCCCGVVEVVDVVSVFTSGGGAVVVVVVSVCFTWGWGVVVVVVVSVCFTCGAAGVIVVSVVCVVWGCARAAGSCEVVVVDCVVLWPITDRDRASTMTEFNTTATSFLDFIRISFVTLDIDHPTISIITNLLTIARSPRRSL
jgi:hypothetical protein